jgi:alcohol dehydrogenase class IV
VDIDEVTVAHEPTVQLIREHVAVARDAQAEVILGIGGGSVIDAAKAIAVLAANDGDVFDYLEVVGRAMPFARPSLPCIAAPTTAGTGSEVTRNAVLSSPEHRVKVSVRSPSMLPAVAVIDPDLTHDLPPALTASTGLDALTQLIEPYLSCRANSLVDALCVEAIPRAARALPRVVRDGRDAAAREDMALASLFGGLALANAGLGAVHGFAAPIGGMFDAPHGAVCAALLPRVFAANARAVSARGTAAARARFDLVARLVTGDPTASAPDGTRWLADLIAACGIPRLSTYGIADADAPGLVDRARLASSMKANAVELTPAELTDILLGAL